MSKPAFSGTLPVSKAKRRSAALNFSASLRSRPVDFGDSGGTDKDGILARAAARLVSSVSRTRARSRVSKEGSSETGVGTGDSLLLERSTYTPTGILVLSIDHNKSNEHKWTDGKKRIEDRLTSFAEVLVDVAKDIKESRVRAEEWKRNWAEEQRLRQEAARLQAEENRRLEQLERQASSWRSACSIRGFIDAVRDEETRRSGAIRPGSSVDQWIQWAERHATSIDPVPSVVANLSPTPTAPGEHHEDSSVTTGDHVG